MDLPINEKKNLVSSKSFIASSKYQNNIPNSIKSQINIFSVPKDNSRKTRTTVELPLLSVANLKLYSTKNEKNREYSRNKENLEIKTHYMVKSFSTKKIDNSKNKNKYHERINRRSFTVC